MAKQGERGMIKMLKLLRLKKKKQTEKEMAYENPLQNVILVTLNKRFQKFTLIQ